MKKAVRQRKMLALWVGTLAFSVMAEAAFRQPAMAQEAARVHDFDIPAKSVRAAMNDIVRISGLDVVFAEAGAASAQGNAVRGSLTPAQAVAALLAGTGLSHRFTNGNTVTISSTARGGAAGADGVEHLGTILIEGGGVDQGFTSELPYRTAGSSAHLSTEVLERVAPTSPGDMFRGTTGVIATGTRGSAIRPSIRGIEGEGRVRTTIDGADQTISAYRGYAGNRDETYVDPDLMSGVDITKGPSGGTIGGTIAFRTITASDILREGRDWGVRLRLGTASNSMKPGALPPNLWSPATFAERPSLFNGENRNASVALAYRNDWFEGVLAWSRRVQGNYFSGANHGSLIDPNAPRAGTEIRAVSYGRPGSEVKNTSEDTETFLAKTGFRWGDGHSLDLGFRRYTSIAGDTVEFLTRAPLQGERIDTRVDATTLRYRWNPADQPLINLTANLWRTEVEVWTAYAASGFPSLQEQLKNSVETTGASIANTSEFDTAWGPLTLKLGAEYAEEDYWSNPAFDRGAAYGSSRARGTRTRRGLNADLSLEPTDWLRLDAGLRRDTYSIFARDNGASYSGGGNSASFGATVTPLEGMQVFALYREGFRPPTVRSIAVQPETARTFELGVNVMRDNVLTEGDSLRVKLALFDNRYSNYTTAGVTAGRPIDAVRMRGGELSLAYERGRFFAEGAVTMYDDIEFCLTAGVCSPHAPRDDRDGSYVPPRVHGSLTLGSRWMDEALVLGARMHFASDRWGGQMTTSGLFSPNTYYWHSYEAYDLFGSYKISEAASLNFSVENLFDTFYVEPMQFLPMPSPGRTARLTLTTRF